MKEGWLECKEEHVSDGAGIEVRMGAPSFLYPPAWTVAALALSELSKLLQSSVPWDGASLCVALWSHSFALPDTV